MGFTNAGLFNGGHTTHYAISYDDTFSSADGITRAALLMDGCEQDFNLMLEWFSGVSFEFSFPISVQIANGPMRGANWVDPPNISLPFGYNPTVTIKPGTGTTGDFIRYLLVSEVTEMFMASQDRGWYESTSLFSGADEGSKREGLSRFLGYEFIVANQPRLDGVRYPNFEVVANWLNAPARPNYVDNNPDDHKPDTVNMLHDLLSLHYLHDQLGFDISKIINAGASTLGGVYRNLTGKSDGWHRSSTSSVPTIRSGMTDRPAGDKIFPVAHLDNLSSAKIQSGANLNERILSLDNLALAEVVVKLASDNPAILSIPPQVTFPVGVWAVGINLTAAAIIGPTQTVNIHATYAGKTLSSSIQILPRPSILGAVGVCTLTDSEPNVSTIRGAMREQRRSVVTEEQRSIRRNRRLRAGNGYTPTGSRDGSPIALPSRSATPLC
jgi:hypothetical protein